MHVLKALLMVVAFLFKAVAVCLGAFFSVILFVLRNAPEMPDEEPEVGSGEWIEAERKKGAGHRESCGRLNGDGW